MPHKIVIIRRTTTKTVGQWPIYENFIFWKLSDFIVGPRAGATAAIKAKLYASIGREYCTIAKPKPNK